jgi:hypothetical protein
VNTLFFRLLDSGDKATTLAEAVDAVRENRMLNAVAHAVDPVSFRQVPGSPFAYWVSDHVLNLFRQFPTFGGEKRTAKQGLATADDFRFIRATWEVPRTLAREWVPFCKGGEFSPYYADIHLVVKWHSEGGEMKAWAETLTGTNHWSRRVASVDFYFRPGLTWPRRTNGLSFRVLPAGCIFADKGPATFVENNPASELLALCAILNSRPFGYLLALQLARTQLAQSYEVGLIQQTPVPVHTPETTEYLATLARCACSLKRSLDTAAEASHAFILPALLQVTGESLSARSRAWAERVRASYEKLAHIQAEIDECAFNLYGIHSSDRQNMLETSHHTDEAGEATDKDDADDAEITHADATALVAQLLSYGIGLGLGRFDLDLALGRRPLSPEPDPFAPLPVCPPGQLQNEHGLPITKEDVTWLKEEGHWNYPIEIPWDGILVDDPGHPLDIEARVHHVLQIIWKDRWEAIEREACEILGVRTLRDYFSKPTGFFADHLKRYSKSRRKAPIYWPLQTPSGSYTLWLYYHRLNDQTLYTCVNDFVEKFKLREVTEQLNVLRSKTNRSKHEENDLERLLDLEQELKDFCDELLRVAPFWKPNLNDGVQIIAAPLWKLFQHRPWQNTLKDTWEKLEKGDYDWAHLAYSIWPDRVRDKCRHDKSLAIAHGLEELYEVPPEQPRKKRGRTRV